MLVLFLGQLARGDISDPDSISSDERLWMFSCFRCVRAHATVCCTVWDERAGLCMRGCVFSPRFMCGCPCVYTCAREPVCVSVARRLSPGIAVPLQRVCMVVDSVDGNV